MVHLFTMLKLLFQLGLYYDPTSDYDPYNGGISILKNYACSGKYEWLLNSCYGSIPLPIPDAHEVCQAMGGEIPLLTWDEATDLSFDLTEGFAFRPYSANITSRCMSYCKTAVSDYQGLVVRMPSTSHLCDCPLDMQNHPKILACKVKAGIPCFYQGVDTDLDVNIKQMKTVNFNESHQIFVIPATTWNFGDFGCNWRLRYTGEAKKSTTKNIVLNIALVVDVKTRQRLPSGHCFGRLVVRDFATGEELLNISCIQDKAQVVERINRPGMHYNSESIQNRAQTYTVYTNTTTVQVQYVIRNDGIGTVGVHVNATAAPEVTLPKRYVATDEGLPQDFTWNMAQEFCESKMTNGSICTLKEVCREGALFGFKATPDDLTKPTRFFPIANDHNKWAEYSAYSACSYAPGLLEPRLPPSWGFEQGNCPRGNCNIKKHIYCCQHDDPMAIRPATTVTIHQESLELFYQIYVYKFNPSRFRRYKPNDTVKRPQYNNWQEIGRLPGELAWFRLMDGYSTEFPTPVYVCVMPYYPNQDEVNHELYIVALKCVEPWQDLYQFYTSLEPRNGTTAIYVGGAVTFGILRTRVSAGSYCCGYDDPNHSFVMYGDASLADELVAPDVAGEVVLRDLTGEVTSSVPLAPSSVPTHDAFIYIVVGPGNGIKLTPTGIIDVGVHRPNDKQCFLSNAALEVSNPVSRRVYGIYCGRHEGHHDVILSDSNVIQIRLMSSLKYNNTRAKFTFQYEEVPYTIPRPMRWIDRSGNYTWESSRKVCQDAGLELCRKSELCPAKLQRSRLGERRRQGAVVPILDDHKRVIEFDYLTCIEKDEDDAVRIFAYETMCCNYTVLDPPSDWPIPERRIQNMTIKQLKFKNHEKLGFGFAVNYSDMAPVVEWRKIPRLPQYLNTSLVTEFTLSRNYTELFNQIVYVCYDDDLAMKIQRTRCPTPGIYTQYRAYAARNNAPDGSLTKIYIGNATKKRGSRVSLAPPCCKYTEDSFELFVLSAKELV